MSNATHWKQRPEGGSRFAIWLIRTIARRGGRAIARAVPVSDHAVFPADARAGAARLARLPDARAARRRRRCSACRAPHPCLRRHHPRSRVPARRTAAALRRRRAAASKTLHAQLDAHGGVLLFGSHLGSFEVLRVLARERPDIQRARRARQGPQPGDDAAARRANPEVAATVIDAGQDGPSIVLAIQQAMAEGALVALLVDRAQPGEAALPAPFLGGDARFPSAPWLIAAVLQAPVVLAFGLYRGGNRYDLVFEPFSGRIEVAAPGSQRRCWPTWCSRYAAAPASTMPAARPTTGSTSTISGKRPLDAPADDESQARVAGRLAALLPRAAGGDCCGDGTHRPRRLTPARASTPAGSCRSWRGRRRRAPLSSSCAVRRC